jgi:hypothetical protein
MPGSLPHSREPLLAQKSQNSDSGPGGSVAVIAIHGVGRHVPGASAEAIATLLSSLGRKDASADQVPAEPPYAGFDEYSIEVPLARVETQFEPSLTGAKSISGKVLSAANDHHQFTFWQKFWGMFNERRGFLAQPPGNAPGGPGDSSKAATPHSTEAKPGREDFGYLYMLEQLADYEGEPERSFATFRFDSRSGRSEQAREFAPEVHIYDAHYSDLSKPESSFTGFFFAFYQLLFHLAGIGLNGVYLAERENSNGAKFWPWRAFSWLHATAVRLLTMFIPILNLVILSIGLSAFADKPSSRVSWIAGYSVAGILGFAATLIARKYHRSPRRPIWWAGIPFLGAAVVILFFSALAWAGNGWISPMGREKWMIVLLWLFVAGGVIYWIAEKFGEVRTGADKIAIPLYLLNVAFFLFVFLRHASGAVHDENATAAFLTIQLVFGEIALCWTLCLVSAFVSWPVSEVCLAGIKDSEKKCRARAAHRTGRFTFAVSASVFLITTMILWSGVAHYTSKQFHVFDRVPVQVVEERSFARGRVAYLIPNVDDLEASYWCTELPRGAQCPDKGGVAPTDSEHPWDHYLDGLVMITVTPGLPITLLLISISFLLLVWAAMPSVLLEIWPKRTPGSEEKTTMRAGEWLSRGLDNVVILIRVLWFAIVPVPLLFGFLNLIGWHLLLPGPIRFVMDALRRLTLPMVQGVGALVAVSAVAIVTLIFKYGVVILDALLDVDNYLRTVPVSQTPRARIAERCTSLLRHIAAYRDPQGRPYERLIIVAHSLGTLVMADLLRFLTISPASHRDLVLRIDGLHADREAPAVPIYLLTMGSPLRPLLNRFFPHLYDWVTRTPDNSCRASQLVPVMEKPREIQQSELPNPRELCVKGWCNTYRSGDYVGRYLWSVGWLKRNEEPQGIGAITRINDTEPATRAEMCIGIGAHTHYWDRNAKDVAETLQDLILNPTRVFP